MSFWKSLFVVTENSARGKTHEYICKIIEVDPIGWTGIGAVPQEAIGTLPGRDRT
jgi:hypothetical protein